MTDVGKLERLPSVSAVWRGEASAFTPWRAHGENLAMLSEALGYEGDWREVIATEASVGDFRADLICRETSPTGRTVLIENQCGRTDQDHLGKLLTYAAGNEVAEEFYLDYWGRFREYHEMTVSPVRPVSPQPQSWIAHGIGKSGISLNLATSLRDGLIKAETYLSGGTAQSYFAQLAVMKPEIEAKLGYSLDWQHLPRDCRICIERRDVDLSDRSEWPQQHQWLLQHLGDFHRAFHSLVKTLDRDQADLPA